MLASSSLQKPRICSLGSTKVNLACGNASSSAGNSVPVPAPTTSTRWASGWSAAAVAAASSKIAS